MIRSVKRDKFSKLSDQIKAEKIRRDKAYETASVYLAREKKAGKITAEEFEAQDKELKDSYEAWALSVGIYENISDEELLGEAEANLKEAIRLHNHERRKVGLKEMTLSIRK